MEKNFVKINFDKASSMWRVEFENGETLKYDKVTIKCPCETVIVDGNAFIYCEYNKTGYIGIITNHLTLL
jgi:hypothetical protein